MTRSYSIEVLNPKNPTGPRVEATIPGKLSLRLYKYDPVKYANFLTVLKVLKDTKAIYTGLRAEHDGGWCYIGKPDTWFVRENVEAPFPSDKLYAVYINPRMIIFDFVAEYVENDDKTSPKGWKERYTGLVWKSSTF